MGLQEIRLGRTPARQAIVCDYQNISTLRMVQSSSEHYLEMGFTERLAEYLGSNRVPDDVIISSLEYVHTQPGETKSIFSSKDSMMNFCRVAEEKTDEFNKFLEMMSLNCPQQLLEDLVPEWSINSRNTSRIRKEYIEVIRELRMKQYLRKRELCDSFNSTDDEIRELSMKEGRRFKHLTLMECMRVDEAKEEATQKGLNTQDTYIFIAKKTGIFINQISAYFRDK